MPVVVVLRTSGSDTARRNGLPNEAGTAEAGEFGEEANTGDVVDAADVRGNAAEAAKTSLVEPAWLCLKAVLGVAASDGTAIEIRVAGGA
jgi:hypothetical protein